MKNYRLYGNKPINIAVLHGGPGAPGSVAAIARELSKDWSVMEPFQMKTSINGQVEELKTQITNNCEIPIILIGHSWGAWLAYIFAYKYPLLVKKLILVGSGPFEKEYVKELGNLRMKRLNSTEREEFIYILNNFHDFTQSERDKYFSRIAELTEKTDTYSSDKINSKEKDLIEVDSGLFQSVWDEAAKLRETKELLNMGRSINCPLVGIQGDYDPHPAAGVENTLKEVISDFTFYLLEKCGHSPWKEKHAKDEFYKLLRYEINKV